MSSANLPEQLVFVGNGGTYPPHGRITSLDHGPAVVTFNWIMFSMTGLTAIARFASRRNITVDGLCILVALTLLIPASISTHLAANNGLGRHIQSISSSKYESYTKATYATQILQVIILTFSKISYFFIFIRIASTSSNKMKRIRLTSIALIALVSAWGIATSIAFAFQCHLPTPWMTQNNTCIQREALSHATSIINIITDMVIITIPGLIVFGIQIQRRQQLGIWAIFATRLVVIAAAAVELSRVDEVLTGRDPTWSHGVVAIWGLIMVNLSIITACIPLMKPFLDALQFSLLDVSTLPFSTQAGSYMETSKNISPVWSERLSRSQH